MTSPEPKSQEQKKPQRLRLVFCGELKTLESQKFRAPCEDRDRRSLSRLRQRRAGLAHAGPATVDSAEMRDFMVHRASIL
jgi:hypothetical protein